MAMTLDEKTGGSEKVVSFRPAAEDIEPGFSKTVEVADVDDALKFLSGEGAIDVHGVDEAKLRRKIDWTVMPFLFLTYFLQYTDKSLGELMKKKDILRLNMAEK